MKLDYSFLYHISRSLYKYIYINKSACLHFVYILSLGKKCTNQMYRLDIFVIIMVFAILKIYIMTIMIYNFAVMLEQC